jgi:hypothetical protein
MTVVADGQCLKKNGFVDHPLFDEIAIESSKPVSRNVNIEEIFPDIS